MFVAAPAAPGNVTLVLSMPPTQTQTGRHRGGAQVGSVDRAGSTFREKESQPPLHGLALEVTGSRGWKVRPRP